MVRSQGAVSGHEVNTDTRSEFGRGMVIRARARQTRTHLTMDPLQQGLTSQIQEQTFRRVWGEHDEA